jgi:ribose-phosphate pyrophosphokinase
MYSFPFDCRLFCGNSNVALAKSVAHYLNTSLGNMLVDRFSDGEIHVDIQENVRGKEVFLLQSTCLPVNEHLMELLIMADALRRSSASRITAIIPYFGYARQDRRIRSARVPITAKMVADMIASVGVTRVLMVDLHAEQIQGFFHMPVDNVYSTPVMMEDIEKRHYEHPVVIVSPDVGGVMRARAIAKRLKNADMAIIDKRRFAPNQTEVMNIIGAVKHKHCIIIDDIVDTAGTLCLAADALKQAGACKVGAYCTHPVLSGQAYDRITQSHGLDYLMVTDTIPIQPHPKISILRLGRLLSEVIIRMQQHHSIRSLCTEEENDVVTS